MLNDVFSVDHSLPGWQEHLMIKCVHLVVSPCSTFCTHDLCSILVCVCVCSVARSCLTLCGPMDYSPPGSSVHGISQARVLE